MVIDDAHPQSATRAASGVINPVTGRRLVTVWMAETLLPFAATAYKKIGDAIGASVLDEAPIISFASSPQMMEAYEKRLQEDNSYITRLADTADYGNFFNILFETYAIQPACCINLHTLQQGWRNILSENGCLIGGTFNQTDLVVHDDHIQYQDITAQKIIYCNGISSFATPYWNMLPYVLNKGEALIVSIPGLPGGKVYKYGAVSIVPWNDGLWWVGSTYENEFDTASPTEAFRTRFTASLKAILKVPFTITDHIASVRPASLERRPFVGIHPHLPAVAILNGMGTKGCSLAPYFAQQLCDHLLNGTPIDPLADVIRFRRMLLQ